MSGQLAAGLADEMVREVRARLQMLEQAAVGLARPKPEELARLRGQLGILVAGLRRVLTEHRADQNGRCPVCRGWVRHRRWPCRVWTVAHDRLMTCDVAELAASETGTDPRPGPPGSVPNPRSGGKSATARPAGALFTVRHRVPGGDRLGPGGQQ